MPWCMRLLIAPNWAAIRPCDWVAPSPSASSVWAGSRPSRLATEAAEEIVPNTDPECQPRVSISPPCSASPTRGPVSYPAISAVRNCSPETVGLQCTAASSAGISRELLCSGAGGWKSSSSNPWMNVPFRSAAAAGPLPVPQPISGVSPGASNASTASTATRDHGSCAPIRAQPRPSSSRCFARSLTSRGAWSSVKPATQLASWPVGPSGAVGWLSASDTGSPSALVGAIETSAGDHVTAHGRQQLGSARTAGQARGVGPARTAGRRRYADRGQGSAGARRTRAGEGCCGRARAQPGSAVPDHSRRPPKALWRRARCRARVRGPTDAAAAPTHPRRSARAPGRRRARRTSRAAARRCRPPLARRTAEASRRRTRTPDC